MTKHGDVHMGPIILEIVTRVLTTFDHCSHCEFLFDQAGLGELHHQREINEYPPDLKEEYLRLSNWIRELSRRYKDRLVIKVIDVQSVLGIYKSIRYRIRDYPTFIVAGNEVYTGWDKDTLAALLETHLHA
jgi:hypothetical protein